MCPPWRGGPLRFVYAAYKDYAHVVAEYDDSHPVAEFRQSRLEAQADEALRQVCRAFEELGVEEDAIVMGIKEVLHGDDFENAEPDENQV